MNLSSHRFQVCFTWAFIIDPVLSFLTWLTYVIRHTKTRCILTSRLTFMCSDWEPCEKTVGGHCLYFTVWIEFALCTVILAEIRFNWGKLNNNLRPGNSSGDCSRLLHIWGAALCQPNGSLTYWGNHRLQSISISASLSLIIFFLFTLCPHGSTMECFTAIHTEIYLSAADNWHFPAGKTEITTAGSSLETKAPFLDK